jgi:hypothetical protein
VHGVKSSSHGLSVLPDVLVSFSLLDEIALATSADAFLSKVLSRVQESDTGACRDFSLGVGGVIQYQRPEDLMPRVCVPHVRRSAVLHTAHGDSVLAYGNKCSSFILVVRFASRCGAFRAIVSDLCGSKELHRLALGCGISLSSPGRTFL